MREPDGRDRHGHRRSRGLRDRGIVRYRAATARSGGEEAASQLESSHAPQPQAPEQVADAILDLAWAAHRPHGHGKPAVVFDIDDTLLNTYDYTLAEQFGYTSASNAIWVNAAAFPAVFYMPQLVSYAASHGYAVFYITGRPQSQTAATIRTGAQRADLVPEQFGGSFKAVHCRRRRRCSDRRAGLAFGSLSIAGPRPGTSRRLSISSPG